MRDPEASAESGRGSDDRGCAPKGRFASDGFRARRKTWTWKIWIAGNFSRDRGPPKMDCFACTGRTVGGVAAPVAPETHARRRGASATPSRDALERLCFLSATRLESEATERKTERISWPVAKRT